MDWPDFTLRNLPQVLGFTHETEKSALGFSRRSSRANPSQPPSGSDARIADWARASGRCTEKGQFTQTLNGYQVDRELGDIFRETPEFGRSLAVRLAEFHETQSEGNLTLIGGGGEAVVFFEPEHQRVIKLLGGDGKAGFGWAIDSDAEGRWRVRPGGLAESLVRFRLAEQHFPTGLDIESVGKNGEFLLLSQPFLVGENPTEIELASWMIAHGWERFVPPAELLMLTTQTWRHCRDHQVIATDVRCENTIRAESDGEIYPFDFVMAWM